MEVIVAGEVSPGGANADFESSKQSNFESQTHDYNLKDMHLADRLFPQGEDAATKNSSFSSGAEQLKKHAGAVSITVTPSSSQFTPGPGPEAASNASTVANTSSSTPAAMGAEGVKVSLIPLPGIIPSSLRREFLVTPGLNGVDVTSLDITPHGCYVLAGCGNGMVLLFDLTQPTPLPALVGQIVAKGLHTNLLLTVKISEDCRYGFAGVNKGSSELLAIDLGRLPGWPNRNTGSTVRRRDDFVSQLVHCYRNSDPKLRGFGDAVRLRSLDNAQLDSNNAVYRLACGRGIKNVHVWQFVSPPPGAARETQPTWTCIYDVASNGNTIESVVFRNGGQELLSKSAGVCLRVWDLRSHETDPQARPTFEDIQNSADVRSLHDGFAFGGTYEFAVVRIAAPKAANRDILEVPERALSLKATGRRMIRQIDDVIATADARHALILCTDGGVIYYNRAMESDQCPIDSLVELSSTQRNPDSAIQIGGRGWALRRVGQEGEVVLLRTLQTNPITIVVAPLSDESSEVKPTAAVGKASPWTDWGYFSDPTIPIQHIDEHLLLPTDRPISSLPLVTPHPAQKNVSIKPTTTNKASHGSGRPPLVPGTGGEKTQVKRVRKAAPAVHHRVTPSSTHTFETSSCSSSSSSNISKLSAPTPVALSLSSSHSNMPEEDEGITQYQRAQQQLYQQQFLRQQLILQQQQRDDEDEAFYSQIPEPPPIKRRPLVLVQPQTVRRVVEVPLKLFGTSLAPRPTLKSVIFERFKSLCSNWIDGGKRFHGRTDAVLANKGLQPLGINTLRYMGSLCVQQDRIKSQFVGEVARCMGRHLQAVTNELSEDGYSKLVSASASKELEGLILRYKGAAAEMVARSQIDLAGYVAMDSLMGAGVDRNDLSVIFRHGDIWDSARGFLTTCELLVDAAKKQRE